jgi:hypothetical protein
MLLPQFYRLFTILPFSVLLTASLACTQGGFGPSRSVGGTVPAGSMPVAVDGSKRSTRPRVLWHRDKAPASLTAQASPPEQSNSVEPPPAQTAPQPSTARETTVVAPGDVVDDCNYWIVSSRSCSAKNAPCDTDCCLEYLHRISDQCLISEGRDSFLASIQPDRPVCFVVHGSYNWWRDVLTESRRINRWIHAGAPGAPVQVVFFTWPSDGNMPFIFPVDIAILGRRSAAHSVYLANLISQLPPDQRVSVLGHSHGARATVAALHLLGGGALENGQALPAGYAVPRHLRAVLIAAAIDHQWLNPGERYGQALVTPERVLLMRNSRDATLGIYPLRKGVGPRALGQYGLGQDDRFILGSLGAKVDELDAAEFAAWHHRFAAYHEHPELASAIVPYVYFQDDTPAGNGRAVTPPQTSPVVEPAKPAQRAPDIGKSSAGNLPLNETGAERSATPVPRRNAVQLQLEP